jgi:large subunit ribosomal protein L18
MKSIAQKKREARLARHRRVRKKVSGSAERPRLCVFKSARHIYVQAIDDLGQNTLAAASTLEARERFSGQRWGRERNTGWD